MEEQGAPPVPKQSALCDSHFGMFVFSFIWHLSVCLGAGVGVGEGNANVPLEQDLLGSKKKLWKE